MWGARNGIDDVEYVTLEWVDWFNNQRLHQRWSDIAWSAPGRNRTCDTRSWKRGGGFCVLANGLMRLGKVINVAPIPAAQRHRCPSGSAGVPPRRLPGIAVELSVAISAAQRIRLRTAGRRFWAEWGASGSSSPSILVALSERTHSGGQMRRRDRSPSVRGTQLSWLGRRPGKSPGGSSPSVPTRDGLPEPHLQGRKQDECRDDRDTGRDRVHATGTNEVQQQASD